MKAVLWGKIRVSNFTISKVTIKRDSEDGKYREKQSIVCRGKHTTRKGRLEKYYKTTK